VTFVSSFPLAFFSYPARTLSLAFSKSIELTSEAPALAARMAASLHKLAMSAPEKPGDNVAKRFAYCSFDIKLESFNGLKCTLKIYARLGKSGKDTSIYRSKRPGRVKAVSRSSGLLVAAIKITF